VDLEDRQGSPLLAAHRRALRGETMRYEGRLVDVPAEVTVKPIRAANEIVGCIAISVDVSDRDREDELFRVSEERFRQFAENLDKVAWMSDATLRQLTYVSRARRASWHRIRPGRASR
jgi:PAS domain-containing protein